MAAPALAAVVAGTWAAVVRQPIWAAEAAASLQRRAAISLLHRAAILLPAPMWAGRVVILPRMPVPISTARVATSQVETSTTVAASEAASALAASTPSAARPTMATK